MAKTTKRPGAARKSKLIEAKKTASAKPASGKAASTEGRSAKAGPAKMASAKAAAHILQAAKGPRTVSHRKIREAVEKVFRERSHARA
jgi:hypothetical protein